MTKIVCGLLLLVAGIVEACPPNTQQVVIPQAAALAQGATLQSQVVTQNAALACGRSTSRTRSRGSRRSCATNSAAVVQTAQLVTVPQAQLVAVQQPQVVVQPAQPNVVVAPSVVQTPGPSDVALPERQFIQQQQATTQAQVVQPNVQFAQVVTGLTTLAVPQAQVLTVAAQPQLALVQANACNACATGGGRQRLFGSSKSVTNTRTVIRN